MGVRSESKDSLSSLSGFFRALGVFQSWCMEAEGKVNRKDDIYELGRWIERLLYMG